MDLVQNLDADDQPSGASMPSLSTVEASLVMVVSATPTVSSVTVVECSDQSMTQAAALAS